MSSFLPKNIGENRQGKRSLFSDTHLQLLTCDKFNMSYSNNRLFTPPFYTPQQQNFVPWSQQASQLLNLSNNFSLLNPLSALPFHPNLLIQQQNNYYNSTLASPLSYLANPHSQILNNTPAQYTQWLSRELLPKKQIPYLQKAKKTPEVICLDEDTPDNVVIIEDSPEQQKVPLVIKNVQKPQTEIQKSELKLQVEKQIKQKVLLSEVKKIEEDLPQKRQNRVTKYAVHTQSDKKTTSQLKNSKKKSIVKDKFVYKLTSHEKLLSQLSEYRQFFPHETVTGPQFQAKLPHLRLFNSKLSAEGRSWLNIRRQKLLERLQTS